MKRTVLTFGFRAGAILAAAMFATLPFSHQIGLEWGMVIGYTSMVLAFLMIFFGVRSYRDNVAGGKVRFGRALAVGSLIALLGSACYVVTWEIIYFNFAHDFLDGYQELMIRKARENGDSEAAIARQVAELEAFEEKYQNPFYNAAVTLMEPLPVGLVIALVSAGVVSARRRREDEEPELAPARA